MQWPPAPHNNRALEVRVADGTENQNLYVIFISFLSQGVLEAWILHFLDTAMVLRHTNYSEWQEPLETLAIHILISKMENLRVREAKGARGLIIDLTSELVLERRAEDNKGETPGSPAHTGWSPTSEHSLFIKRHLERAVSQKPAEIVYLINARNSRDKGKKGKNSTKPCRVRSPHYLGNIITTTLNIYTAK